MSSRCLAAGRYWLGKRKRRRRSWLVRLILSCLLCLGGPAVAAHPQHPPPGHTRTLHVLTVSKGPVIDGKLDDPVWKRAPVTTDFWISGQNRWPQDQTEVRVVADSKTLYIAFHCYDSIPADISARQETRDGGLGYDDQVTVQLDTFDNHRSISNYSVNAIGTQSDSIAGGRASQIEWKGDWQAAVARTKDGWTAEIAIPFRILNYSPGASVFAVNFLRYQHRTGELSSWADTTPQNLPEEMGRLVGLKLPTKAKARPWTFMPYILAGRNAPNRDGRLQRSLLVGGMDIRYEPRPNLTAVATLNPDFSQLERQVTNIDFSYTEKYLADPRPFFQEGASYFDDDTRYFYSNRIPNFDAGLKAFTQTDKYRLGALITKAPNQRWDAVLQYNRYLDATHGVAASLVSTRRNEFNNNLVALNYKGREQSGMNYALGGALSETDNTLGNGASAEVQLGWQGNYWSLGSTLDHYDRTFFPADGLINSDVIGTNGASAYVNYLRDYGDSPIREINGSITRSIRRTLDGRLQRRNWYLGGTIESRSQIKLGLYYFVGDYRPAIPGQHGEYANTLNQDWYWTTSLDFNTRSSVYGYGISHSYGQQGGGAYRYTDLYAWVRPTRSVFFNFSSERMDSFGHYDQTILSAGWDITPEQGIVGRIIDSNFGRSLRLAYRRQVRTGVDTYLVYDREPNQQASISLKLVWSFH